MEKIVYSTDQFTDLFKDMINDGASVPLGVTGTSMRPFLVQDRDVVWLRACRQDDLKRGSIVLFKRNDGSVVLHRIRKVLKDGTLFMNGDAQTWCEKTTASSVLAVVVQIERNSEKIDCSEREFVFKSELWQLAKPVRPLLLKVWNRFKNKLE